MIADVFDLIETTMRGLGFTLVADEESLKDRHYRIAIGEASQANDVRGGMNSGVVRVDWTVTIRLQFSADTLSARRPRQIAVDLETVFKAIYDASKRAKLVGLGSEEATGGVIGLVAMSFDGSIT